MSKVYLLSTQSGDWEGLYIKGELIQEGHVLGEGKEPQFWLDIASMYGVKSDDLIIKDLEDEDNDNAESIGSLPFKFTDLVGSYS